MPAVATYARISRDPEGRAEGVAAQQRKAAAYAAEHWPGAPVRAFVDNDLSAATPGTTRPGYEALLAAVRRGEVAQLVVAEQSRLTRQPSEWEDLVVILSRAGIAELHTYRKGIVAVSGSRLMGRILAAVDAEEVERLRARVSERLDTLAAEGRPPGGPSYGYRRGVDEAGRKVLVVDEDQAEVIREAAGRVLAGWSLTRIAADLTERGIPTARGGRWAATTVRSTLTRPTIAGLRVHRGEVVGEGMWSPILPPDEWRQVVAVLGRPVDVQRADGSRYRARRTRATGRRYLLTGGVAVCGKCGTPLTAQQRRSRAGGRSPSYLCPPARGGCAGIGIAAEPLEQHVAAEILDRLTRPDFVAAVATDDHGDDRQHLAAQLAQLDERSAELATMWAAGDLASDEWRAARAAIDSARSDLAARMAALPSPVVELDPSIVAEGWAAMNLDERRLVIATFVEAVVVSPAKPGTRRFDPGRLLIRWRR